MKRRLTSKQKAKKHKKIVIITTVCLLFIMVTCYATFQTSISLNAKGNVKTPVNAVSKINSLINESSDFCNDDPDGNVRYCGLNPNNYVIFNDELWRIIGIFNEKIKIVKATSLDSTYYWNNAQVSGKNYNDWVTASLNIYLNGDYLNSMTSDAQKMISIETYYLGGIADYGSATASDWYSAERTGTVYSGNQLEWSGKIALLYPSDYGFASNGGSLSNKMNCRNKELYNWSSDSYDYCIKNDWLYKSVVYWFLSPYPLDGNYVAYVYANGRVSGYNTVNDNSRDVFPVLYLNGDVKISTGDGTETNAYRLIC